MLCVKIFFWWIGYRDFDLTVPKPSDRYTFVDGNYRFSLTRPQCPPPQDLLFIWFIFCLSLPDSQGGRRGCCSAHFQVWICPRWCREPAAVGLLYNWFRKVTVGLISSLTQGYCEDTSPEWVNWVVWDESIIPHRSRRSRSACQQVKVFDILPQYPLFWVTF